MFNWITSRISVKISLSLIVVLAVIMGISAQLFLQQRAEVLRGLMLTKARTLALVGGSAMERILEEALDSGRLTRAQLFDTDHRRITEGPLSGSKIHKYHTAYDRYLEPRVQPLLDTFLEEDETVVFAVLVDRKGYAPTHHSRYSRDPIGDEEQDRIWSRGKRLFNDATGIAAARYDGSDGQKVLRQTYPRDTGEIMWDVTAPVFVKGEHWGGFRIGLSIRQTEEAVAALRTTLLLGMLLVLAVASLTIHLVVVRITRPLKKVTEVAHRISGGSLDATIEATSRDEIGQLARAFNQMTQVIFKNLQSEVEKSSRLIDGLKDAIQQLSSSANEILAISSQQSSGATQQAAAVQQATTTSEEIAVSARQMAENARRVEALAERSNGASSEGVTAVGQANEGMGRLKEQVQSVAHAVLELGENSQKIGGIVEIIDEISDQTNLLALNAAIEAAGAGEAGKRFSIVANEVRRLAERTGSATTQIKALVDEIQKSTNGTILLTEEGTKGVDAAAALVANIAGALSKILAMVQETTIAAREIKLSTQQQTTASEQMAQTIAEVRDVANQVAASAEETAEAIAELTELAERLRSQVEEEA